MMRSIRKITAVGLSVAAAAGFTAATQASAKKKPHKKQHVSSQIALQTAGVDGIGGRVSASGKACRSQRQVTLYRVNSQASVPTNEFIASTWTRGDGSWSFPGPQYPSLYFAEVSKKTVPKTRKHGAVICRFAVSNGNGFG
jgi:hypothetical protein